MTTNSASLTRNAREKKALWNSAELSQALGFNLDDELSIKRISIDSRSAEEGDLFIGIKGNNFDGDRFAIDALKKGAELAIVEKMPEEIKGFETKLIKVESSYDTLISLARFARSRTEGKIIGVTGSVGKTTTKEMLKIALENQGETFSTEKNYNNEIGVPLALANMPRNTEYAIFEMGMRGEGQIRDLTTLVKPHTAIITEVGPVHLEFFNSVAAIAAAKSEIFEGLVENGTAIINLENDYKQIMINAATELNCQIITFGKSKEADFRILNYNIKNHSALIEIEHQNKSYHCELNAPGEHLAMNIAAVLAAVSAVGGELEYASRALSEFQVVQGRGNIVRNRKHNWSIIDDTYNANPFAMTASLNTLGLHHAAGRKIAILGEMQELGRDAPTMHADLLSPILKNRVDLVICIGNNMMYLHDKLPANISGGHFKDADDFMQNGRQLLHPNDTILVKSSHWLFLNRVVEFLAELDD